MSPPLPHIFPFISPIKVKTFTFRVYRLKLNRCVRWRIFVQAVIAC